LVLMSLGFDVSKEGREDVSPADFRPGDWPIIPTVWTHRSLITLESTYLSHPAMCNNCFLSRALDQNLHYHNVIIITAMICVVTSFAEHTGDFSILTCDACHSVVQASQPSPLVQTYSGLSAAIGRSPLATNILRPEHAWSSLNTDLLSRCTTTKYAKQIVKHHSILILGGVVRHAGSWIVRISRQF